MFKTRNNIIKLQRQKTNNNQANLYPLKKVYMHKIEKKTIVKQNDIKL